MINNPPDGIYLTDEECAVIDELMREKAERAAQAAAQERTEDAA